MAKHANWNRRHFEEVAEVLRNHRRTDDPVQSDDLAFAFAEKFQEANPGFDRRRFLKACGVPLADDE